MRTADRRPAGVPPRRAARRARHVLAAATLGTVLWAPAAPAAAHGAPVLPLSRTAACGPEGGAASRGAACRAARAAGPDTSFADWDAVRVPGVDGHDRAMIRDGTLCSGGLPAFRGLDLPRADWPVTTLVAGATMTFRYRATIPHRGEFRLFVTRARYDPTAPLRWSDLQDTPFARVTDPPLSGGAYRIRVTLPTGLTGRHLIYTVWQNAGPDTYYSCSDVVFQGPAASAPTRQPAPSGGAIPAGHGAPSGDAVPPDGSAAASGEAAAGARDRIAPASDAAGPAGWEVTALGVAVLAAAAAAGTAVLHRRRQAGRPGTHGG